MCMSVRIFQGIFFMKIAGLGCSIVVKAYVCSRNNRLCCKRLNVCCHGNLLPWNMTNETQAKGKEEAILEIIVLQTLRKTSNIHYHKLQLF